MFSDPAAALKDSSIHVNAKMHIDGTCRTNYSGTTACYGLVIGNKLIMANVGDSRAILGRRGRWNRMEAMDLTVDHKPEDPEERVRIEYSGGAVAQQEYDPGQFEGPFRVFRAGTSAPGLAMSRSLGDLEAEKVGVIPDADTSTWEFKRGDELLLIASDGLWEVRPGPVANTHV